MPRECCDHGVPGGCPVVCACGHACRRHDAGGCRFEGEPMVEVLLTAILGPMAPVECDCSSFSAAGGEG